MSTPYVHQPYRRWDSEEYDAGVVQTVRISCNSRDRKEYLKNTKSLIAGLMDSGDLIPTRCDCTHCLNDWDCCGNLIGYTPKIHKVKGGLKIVQYAARNV